MRKISDLLSESVERSEVLRNARARRTLDSWPSVVGEVMAQHCVPSRLDRGILWIAVDGSAWSQEILLRKSLILMKLNEIAGEKALFTGLRTTIRPPEPRASSNGGSLTDPRE